MSTLLRLFAAAAVLAAVVSVPRTVQAQREPPPPTTGRVLVLDNERLLEGDIERQGEQYCVRDQNGEMRLPASKVLKLCANRDEAFAFICSRTNLRDPDEHLRLARWCQQNDLNEQAIREAAVAVEMRPHHPGAENLLDVLKRSAAVAAQPATPASPPLPPPTLPPVDVGLESFSTFATRVQPILMNTCIRCHTEGRGGSFDLVRAGDGLALNHRATQYNLAAVLRQVNVERPELSPLLIKAESPHGNCSQAPLRGRDSVPYESVRTWVEMTVANNPHLREAAKASAALAAAAPPSRLPEEPRAQSSPAVFAPQHSPPATLPPLPQTVRLAPAVPRPAGPKSPDTAPPPTVHGGTIIGQTGSPSSGLQTPPERQPPTPRTPPQDTSPPAPVDDYDPVRFNYPSSSQN